MTADLFTRGMAQTERPADTRTVLIGMNNPLSPHPRHALYPSPVNCTGWRVWRMIADIDPTVEEDTYIAGLDRRNVLSSRAWSGADARAAGRELMDALSGRRLVVLGVQTLSALGLPRPRSWCTWVRYIWLPDAETPYTLLPHPSGRCREYNDPVMRREAGELLLAELRRHD